MSQEVSDDTDNSTRTRNGKVEDGPSRGGSGKRSIRESRSPLHGPLGVINCGKNPHSLNSLTQ